MRSTKMIDDALRVSKSEAYVASPSLFHNFDYALNELTCKLTEGVNMEEESEKLVTMLSRTNQYY